MASRIVLVAVIALALTVAGVQAQQDSAEEGGGDRASARAQPPDATATPLPQRPRQAYFEAGGEVMEAGALAEQLGLLEEPAATAPEEPLPMVGPIAESPTADLPAAEPPAIVDPPADPAAGPGAEERAAPAPTTAPSSATAVPGAPPTVSTPTVPPTPTSTGTPVPTLSPAPAGAAGDGHDGEATATPTPTATRAPSSLRSSPPPLIGTARPAPTLVPSPVAIGGSFWLPYLGNPDADTPIRASYPWLVTPGTPITVADPWTGTTGPEEPAAPRVSTTGAAPVAMPAWGSAGVTGPALGSTSVAAPTPTPPPAGPGGVWSGTTSQGRPITFTVSGNSITAISVGYSISGCVSQEGTLSQQFSQPGTAPSITDGSFFALTPPSTGLGIGFVRGTFTSNTSASGTFQLSLFSLGALDPSGNPCAPSIEATWTASKG